MNDNSTTTEAISTYAIARGYVESIYTIVTSERRFHFGDDTLFAHTVMFLAGFATELYLKAYLQSKGVSGRPIRTHDLERLELLSVEKGLDVLRTGDLVALLSEPHKNHLYRYPKLRDKLSFYGLSNLFSDFSVLDIAIDEAVGATASIGGTGGNQWTLPKNKDLWRFPSG